MSQVSEVVKTLCSSEKNSEKRKLCENNLSALENVFGRNYLINQGAALIEVIIKQLKEKENKEEL